MTGSASGLSSRNKSSLDTDSIYYNQVCNTPPPTDLFSVPSLSGQGGQANGGQTPANGGQTPSNGAPTIVIDPGHSGQDISDSDPQTGLYDHDYPNHPEITEVFTVAQAVEKQLKQDGYNVIMTKKSADDSVSLRDRAEIANKANADLALSIHDTHDTSWSDMSGGDGGQVYVQNVGNYRQNPPGLGRGTQKVTFTDSSVAQKSQQYGRVFAGQRTKAENHTVSVAPISFDSRSGLAGGNIPEVQLFSKVPWVYNEVGAPNGPLSQTELDEYAKGLIAGVENSIPSDGSVSQQADGSVGACCPPGGGGDVTSLSGKDGIEQTINFFLQEGLSLEQASGIAANLAWETGGGTAIDPLVSGPNPSGDAWGVAQWTPPSNYTSDKSKIGVTGPDNQLLTQLEVLWGQIQGKGTVYSTNILPGLEKTNDPGEAADYFRENFERCDTSNASCTTDRVNTAKQFFNQYNGNSLPGNFSAGAQQCGAVGGGAPGTVGAAVAAAKQMSDMKIGYVWGGLHSPGQLAITSTSKLQSIGADCSGSTSWVVHQAGMYNSSTGMVSGGFGTWGQAGKGQQMTIWENSDHVFIEFNVPGIGHYQFNTSYGSANGLSSTNMPGNTPGASGPGPQFFPWGQNGQADADGGTFTPRHWPGT